MILKTAGHTAEGEMRQADDGTWVFDGEMICGPHDEHGNHTTTEHAAPNIADEPVICRGCEAIVATFGDPGLGGQLTDHDRDCGTHAWAGCAHDGVCYEKAGMTGIGALAGGDLRVTELVNGSHDA